MNDDIIVYSVDVGKEDKNCKKSNFGWINSGDEQGFQLSTLVSSMKECLKQQRISIGFEFPLYFDVYDYDVNRQRQIDNGRSWSASAGATIIPTGLAQANFIFRALNSYNKSLTYCILTQFDDLNQDYDIFIWEAFISGKNKSQNENADSLHIMDAKIALEEYSNCQRIDKIFHKENSYPCISLIAPIILANNCNISRDSLTKRPIVIQPPE